MPFSLPADLDLYLRQEAQRTGQSIAHVIRRALGVGMPLQDDPATLARAVRDVYTRPNDYPISLKIALREACEAAEEEITEAIALGRMLPGDAATIDGYVRQVGPYQIGPSHWVYGPLSRKDRGDGFDFMVPGEAVLESNHALSPAARIPSQTSAYRARRPSVLGLYQRADGCTYHAHFSG